MDLKKRLLSDTQGAMRAKDSLRLNTLRLLSSEIKNKEIDLHRELKDDEILSILSSQIKRRKEAITLYQKGGRPELAAQEEQEAAILKDYLPEQVSEEVLRQRVVEVVRDTGAQGPRDMGKVMKVVVAEFKGQADGNLIRRLVIEAIEKQG